jgi:photosystem II stability/assembly factor-like uncharacterized protein
LFFTRPTYWMLLCSLVILGLSSCQSTSSSANWHWEPANAGLPHQAIVLAVAADPTDPKRLWVGYYASGGFATSLNGGQSWSTGAVGLDDNPIFDLLPVPADSSSLLEPAKSSFLLGENQGGVLWAATRDGLLQSLDAGASWQPAPGNLPLLAAFALAVDSTGRLYVGLDGAGVYAQTQNGPGWEALATGGPLASAAVISLAVSPDGQQLYAGTPGQGVFASYNGGQTWLATYTGEYAPNVVLHPNKPDMAVASLRRRLVRTRDGGRSWHTIPLEWASDEIVSLLWLSAGSLGAGTGKGRLYRSLDDGDTWLAGGAGLPPNGGVLDIAVVGGQDSGGQHLLAGTWTGVYVSDDGGQTWTSVLPSLGSPHPQALLSTGAGLLLGTQTGLFRWQRNMRRWESIPGEFLSGVASLAADPADSRVLYAGTVSHGVYRSEDAGATWQQLPSIVTGIPALAVDSTDSEHIYILAAWERVYASQDGGQNWEARWQGLGNVLEATSLAVDPFEPMAYVGTETSLYRSDNGGEWNLVAEELIGQSILSLMVQPMPTTTFVPYSTKSNSMLYIGTTQGAFRSLDQGDTVESSGRRQMRWGQGLENLSVTAFLAEPDTPRQLYAGTAFAGVYQSPDGGQHWHPIGPAELTNQVIKALAWGPNGQLFVIATDGVWRGQRQ